MYSVLSFLVYLLFLNILFVFSLPFLHCIYFPLYHLSSILYSLEKGFFFYVLEVSSWVRMKLKRMVQCPPYRDWWIGEALPIEVYHHGLTGKQGRFVLDKNLTFLPRLTLIILPDECVPLHLARWIITYFHIPESCLLLLLVCFLIFSKEGFSDLLQGKSTNLKVRNFSKPFF